MSSFQRTTAITDYFTRHTSLESQYRPANVIAGNTFQVTGHIETGRVGRYVAFVSCETVAKPSLLYRISYHEMCDVMELPGSVQDFTLLHEFAKRILPVGMVIAQKATRIRMSVSEPDFHLLSLSPARLRILCSYCCEGITGNDIVMFSCGNNCDQSMCFPCLTKYINCRPHRTEHSESVWLPEFSGLKVSDFDSTKEFFTDAVAANSRPFCHCPTCRNPVTKYFVRSQYSRPYSERETHDLTFPAGWNGEDAITNKKTFQALHNKYKYALAQGKVITPTDTATIHEKVRCYDEYFASIHKSIHKTHNLTDYNRFILFFQWRLYYLKKSLCALSDPRYPDPEVFKPPVPCPQLDEEVAIAAVMAPSQPVRNPPPPRPRRLVQTTYSSFASRSTNP
jgi:hypothetical protein